MVRNNPHKIEKLIFMYVNISRRKNKISVLRFDRGLRYISRLHSSKMAKRRRIYHGDNVHIANKHIKGDSGIEDFLSFIFKILLAPFIGGFGGGGSGENVAMMPRGRVRGFKRTIKSDKDIALALHKTWMKSPGHRTNILNSNFGRIGIGIKRRGNMYYATQVFHS